MVTNEHLEHRLGCKPELLFRMTGIRERRHALPHQCTSDLCCEAAWRCLERSGVRPDEVDLLLRFYRTQKERLSENTEAATALAGVKTPARPPLSSERAAWTACARVLLNLHETITRN